VIGAVWIDGSLVPGSEARVSVFDHGLTVGDGVFETCKVVRGEPFAPSRHLARLRRSASGLGLDVPVTDDVLREAMAVVIRSNAAVGRVRVTVTGGVAPAGSSRAGGRPTVIVGGGVLEPWPEQAVVCTVPWPRNERGATAGLKTTSYAENVVALAHAHRAGGAEAIFANTAGNLCEGTGSNVFAVLDGALVTPPLESGCLAGVTRELVLELVAAEERDVPIDRVVTEAEEAFLTSSTRDIQAIGMWDERPLEIGPFTRAITKEFASLVARDLDP
jgi:branched-chain amino acid aminotransferase